MIYVTHVRYLFVLYFILKEKKGPGKHSFFLFINKMVNRYRIPPKVSTWQFVLVDCVRSELRETAKECICFFEQLELENWFTEFVS